MGSFFRVASQQRGSLLLSLGVSRVVMVPAHAGLVLQDGVAGLGSFFRPASRHGVGVALRAPSCLRPSPPGPAAEDWLCFVAPAEHRKPDRAGVSPRAADHGWNSQPPQHLTSSTLALRATLVTRSPQPPGVNLSHILESDENIESSPSRHGHAVAQSHVRRR